MEIDCHNRSVDRCIKVKKRNVLLSPVGLSVCHSFPVAVNRGFCSIHHAVTLAGLKNVNRYIGNIVLSKIVVSAFHCILNSQGKWKIMSGVTLYNYT